VHIDIVTPSGCVLEGDIESITIPSTEGEIGLLTGHIPIISALDVGPLTVTMSGGKRTFAVEGGFVEMARDRINVITEMALTPDEIDVSEATQALNDARAALKEAKDGGPAETQKRLRALKRANTLLKVAKSK
jgi:F-type H+-transporting ATPase subunit epsilon